MSEIPIHGKSKKKSLYVFGAIFAIVMFVSVYFVPQYLPIPINQQTIGLFALFSLFIAIISLGFHHKKLKFAHTPALVGFIMLVIGGSLVYGALKQDGVWWVFQPEQIGMFAVLALGGIILTGIGLAQVWKKTNT